MDIFKVVFTTDRQGHSGLIGNRSLLADSKHQRPEDGGASGRKFAAASLSLTPASRGWAASTDQLTFLCTIHILSLMLAKLQMSQKHLNLAQQSAVRMCTWTWTNICCQTNCQTILIYPKPPSHIPIKLRKPRLQDLKVKFD